MWKATWGCRYLPVPEAVVQEAAALLLPVALQQRCSWARCGCCWPALSSAVPVIQERCPCPEWPGQLPAMEVVCSVEKYFRNQWRHQRRPNLTSRTDIILHKQHAHLILFLRRSGAAACRRLCHSSTVTCCHAANAAPAEPSQAAQGVSGLQQFTTSPKTCLAAGGEPQVV